MTISAGKGLNPEKKTKDIFENFFSCRREKNIFGNGMRQRENVIISGRTGRGFRVPIWPPGLFLNVG